MGKDRDNITLFCVALMVGFFVLCGLLIYKILQDPTQIKEEVVYKVVYRDDLVIVLERTREKEVKIIGFHTQP